MAWEPLLEAIDVCIDSSIPETVICPQIYWTFSNAFISPPADVATASLPLSSLNGRNVTNKTSSLSSTDLSNYLNAVDDPGVNKLPSSCFVKVDVSEVINFNVTVGLIEVIHSTAQGVARILGK